MRGGFWRLARADVAAIFEPVVAQVEALVAAQVAAVGGAVAAVLLVGGFGSSEHLFARLQAWARAHAPLAVLQPRNAWTAVVRGAIIRGLQGDTVAARMARRWYGVVHDARWDPARHAQDERQWHELRCEWVVRNRVQWYIRRGDVVRPSAALSFPFYRTIAAADIAGDAHALRTELWVCDDEAAPARRDARVRKLCVMTSAPVPVDRFVVHKNENGQVFYRVDYSLDMTVTGGAVIYEMSMQQAKGDSVEKVKVGRVEVSYE